jgi:hypothetical protein
MVDVATQAAVVSRPSQRRFYTGIAVVIAGIVFAGFARTYYLRGLFTAEPPPGLLHLHGLVFTSWLLLFVVQTTLVAAGRTDVHRRLGVAGGVLAATMLVVGVLTAIHAAQRGGTPLGLPPLRFMVIPLGDITVFSILVTAALLYRRKPEIQQAADAVCHHRHPGARHQPPAFCFHPANRTCGVFWPGGPGAARLHRLRPVLAPESASCLLVGRPADRGVAAFAPYPVGNTCMDGLRAMADALKTQHF